MTWIYFASICWAIYAIFFNNGEFSNWYIIPLVFANSFYVVGLCKEIAMKDKIKELEKKVKELSEAK